MANKTPPRDQSSPSHLSQPLPFPTRGVSADATAASGVVRVSRQGISVTFPQAFWARALLFVIGVCCYAGGYILLEMAMTSLDDDDDDDDDAGRSRDIE